MSAPQAISAKGAQACVKCAVAGSFEQYRGFCPSCHELQRHEDRKAFVQAAIVAAVLVAIALMVITGL